MRHGHNLCSHLTAVPAPRIAIAPVSVGQLARVRDQRRRVDDPVPLRGARVPEGLKERPARRSSHVRSTARCGVRHWSGPDPRHTPPSARATPPRRAVGRTPASAPPVRRVVRCSPRRSVGRGHRPHRTSRCSASNTVAVAIRVRASSRTARTPVTSPGPPSRLPRDLIDDRADGLGVVVGGEFLQPRTAICRRWGVRMGLALGGVDHRHRFPRRCSTPWRIRGDPREAEVIVGTSAGRPLLP